MAHDFSNLITHTPQESNGKKFLRAVLPSSVEDVVVGPKPSAIQPATGAHDFSGVISTNPTGHDFSKSITTPQSKAREAFHATTTLFSSPLLASGKILTAAKHAVENSKSAQKFIQNQSNKLEKYADTSEALAQTPWKNIVDTAANEAYNNYQEKPNSTVVSKAAAPLKAGGTVLKYAPVVLAKLFNQAFDTTGTDTTDFYAAKNRNANTQYLEDVKTTKINPSTTPPPEYTPKTLDQMTPEEKLEYSNYVNDINYKKVLGAKAIFSAEKGLQDSSLALGAKPIEGVMYNIAGPDATKWMKDRQYNPTSTSDKILYGAGAIGGTILDYYVGGKLIGPAIGNLEAGQLAPMVTKLGTGGKIAKGALTLVDAFMRNAPMIIGRSELDYALTNQETKDNAITNFNNITGEQITADTDPTVVRQIYNTSIANIDSNVAAGKIDKKSAADLKGGLSNAYYEFGKNAFNTGVNAAMDAALWSLGSLAGPTGSTRFLKLPAAFVAGFASAKLQHADTKTAIQQGAIATGMAGIGLVQTDAAIKQMKQGVAAQVNNELSKIDTKGTDINLSQYVVTPESSYDDINKAINLIALWKQYGTAKTLNTLLNSPDPFLELDNANTALKTFGKDILDLKVANNFLSDNPDVYQPWFKALYENILRDIYGTKSVTGIFKETPKQPSEPTPEPAQIGTTPVGPTGPTTTPGPVQPVQPVVPQMPTGAAPTDLHTEVMKAQTGDFSNNKYILNAKDLATYYSNPSEIQARVAAQPVITPEVKPVEPIIKPTENTIIPETVWRGTGGEATSQGKTFTAMGTHFAENKEMADQFAADGNAQPYKISPDTKLYDYNDLRKETLNLQDGDVSGNLIIKNSQDLIDSYDPALMKDKLESLGYDGLVNVQPKGGKEFVIWNKEKILSEKKPEDGLRSTETISPTQLWKDYNDGKLDSNTLEPSLKNISTQEEANNWLSLKTADFVKSTPYYKNVIKPYFDTLPDWHIDPDAIPGEPTAWLGSDPNTSDRVITQNDNTGNYELIDTNTGNVLDTADTMGKLMAGPSSKGKEDFMEMPPLEQSVSNKTNPKADLEQVALKYDNVKDFIKSLNGPYYHGTSAGKNIKANGFNLYNVGKTSHYPGVMGVGIYLDISKDASGAKLYGNEVLEVYIPNDLNLFKWDGGLDAFYAKSETQHGDPYLITKYMQSKGYDGIIGGNEMVIFDPNNVYTINRLKAIWKDARKGILSDIEVQTTPDGKVVPVKAITPEMVDTAGDTPEGFNDIRGSIVRNAEDVAALLQQFRDRTKEIAHIIYTNKDGVILGHVAFTSNSFSYVYIPDKEVAFKIKQRAARLGADTIYIAHNHPSGQPIPSAGDLLHTEDISKRLTDPLTKKSYFGGSIVLDHDHFSVAKISANNNAVFSTHKVPEEYINKAIIEPNGENLNYAQAEEKWVNAKYGGKGLPKGKYVVAIVTPQRTLIDSREFNVSNLSTSNSINSAITQFAHEKKGLPIVYMEASVAAKISYDPQGVLSFNLHNKSANDWTCVDLTSDYRKYAWNLAKKKKLSTFALWQDIVPRSNMSEEDRRKIAETITSGAQYEKLPQDVQDAIYPFLTDKQNDLVVKYFASKDNNSGEGFAPEHDTLAYFSLNKLAYPPGQSKAVHSDEYRDLPPGVMANRPGDGLPVDVFLKEYNAEFGTNYTDDEFLNYLQDIARHISRQEGEFAKKGNGKVDPIVQEILGKYAPPIKEKLKYADVSQQTLDETKAIELGSVGSPRRLFSLMGNKGATSPMYDYLYTQLVKQGIENIVEPYGGAGTLFLNSLRNAIDAGLKNYITNIFDIEKYNVLKAVQEGKTPLVKSLVKLTAQHVSDFIRDNAAGDIKDELNKFFELHPKDIIGGDIFKNWAIDSTLDSRLTTFPQVRKGWTTLIQAAFDSVYVKEPKDLNDSVAKMVIEHMGIRGGSGQGLLGANGFKSYDNLLFGTHGVNANLDAAEEMFDYAKANGTNILITNYDGTKLLSNIPAMDPTKTAYYLDPPYITTSGVYGNIKDSSPFDSVNKFFELHQGYFDEQKKGAKLFFTNEVNEQYIQGMKNKMPGANVLAYTEGVTPTTFISTPDITGLVNDYTHTPRGKFLIANARLVNLQAMLEEKDIAPDTKGKLKKLFGIDEFKTATNEQLDAMAAYVGTLETGDRLLTDKQKKGIGNLLKTGDFVMKDPVVNIDLLTQREAFATLSEKEDIPHVPGLPTMLLPTSYIASAGNNPIIASIVEDARVKMQTAGENTQARLETFKTLVRAAEISRRKILPTKENFKRFMYPEHKEIFASLEGKAVQLTPEEEAVVNYLKDFFKVVADDPAMDFKNLRTHYVTHLDMDFMEMVVDRGPLAAIKYSATKKSREPNIPINIFLELHDTISSSKFFRFAMQRNGGVIPTENIMRILSEYSSLYEQKKALDQILPEMEVAVNSEMVKPRAAKWLLALSKALAGSPPDSDFQHGETRWIAQTIDKIVSLKYIASLSFNVVSAISNVIAGESNSIAYTGVKNYLIGKKRLVQDPKKVFKMMTKYGLNENSFYNYVASALQGAANQIARASMFGHSLGEMEIRGSLMASMLTEEEWQSGEISKENFRDIYLAMNRTQGTYSKLETPLGLQTILGRAVLQFNRWQITNMLLLKECISGTILDARAAAAAGKPWDITNSKWASRLTSLTVQWLIATTLNALWISKLTNKYGKKFASTLRAMGETIQIFFDLPKTISDLLTNNPTLDAIKRLSFTLQTLESKIPFTGVQPPQAFQIQSGIEKMNLSPINTWNMLTGQSVGTIPKKSSSKFHN